MCKEEVHELAQQVLRDRLVGWGAKGGTKPGTVAMFPVLAPTEAEARWQELVGPRQPERTTFTVHPAVLKLAAEFKAAKLVRNAA